MTEATNEVQEHESMLKTALGNTGSIERIVKYVLIAWGVCVVAGAAIAIGLANAGMKTQDAFNSGLAFALLPIIAVAILVAAAWVISWF